MNEFRRAAVTAVLKRVLDTVCKIDSGEFLKALRQESGAPVQPMIIAVNHINFLEVPILVTHIYPLLMTGLVKAETWKNPFMAFLADTYSAVPLDRKGSFIRAFEQARSVMQEGFFLCVAPEGTRSKTGILGRGKAGVVQLAQITGAPVLPVVHFGGEYIWRNLRRFKRTPLRFRAGRPFRFKFEGSPGRLARRQMLEELMGQMAALLPEELRGPYAEQALRECEYLEFL
jgi:1-acyl-sn-glycerol-3-phosphate acyltransferase